MDTEDLRKFLMDIEDLRKILMSDNEKCYQTLDHFFSFENAKLMKKVLPELFKAKILFTFLFTKIITKSDHRVKSRYVHN